MRNQNFNVSFKLRDVVSNDLAALSAIKPTIALHLDRIRDADNDYIRYMVAEQDNTIIGFGLIVFKSPETWTKMRVLPAIIDLYVNPDFQSQGIGTSMIHEMEKTAFKRGCSEIFVGVDPDFNQRAYSLYLRLGYKPLDKEPYLEHWSLAISNGELREGDNWIIYLRKELYSVNQ
jgi:ribosomal protein S18 acetylase RimI-like enzyme